MKMKIFLSSNKNGTSSIFPLEVPQCAFGTNAILQSLRSELIIYQLVTFHSLDLFYFAL